MQCVRIQLLALITFNFNLRYFSFMSMYTYIRLHINKSSYMEIHVHSPLYSTQTCTYTVHNSPTTSSVNTSMATPAIMREGTTKLSPQGGLGSLVVGLAQKDGMMVPRIFPREVCAFQIPIISPRLHTKYR